MTSKTKIRIVKTYTGKSAKRTDCKKIKGEFYLVGDSKIKDSGECYLVDGKYHRFNNGKIEYDYEKKKYVLIHKNHLKYGVVNFENDEIIYGYFTPKLTENVLIYNKNKSKTEHCISEEVAKKMKYREQVSSGVFFDRNDHNSNYFTRIGKPPIRKNDLPYDSRFSSNITRMQYNEEFKPEYNNENLNKFGDFLESNNITFGIEFETSSGYIPDRLAYKYGLLALRDGSIDGLEYVTIPLSGRKGLYALRNICYELSKRCKYNMRCALHIHLGGLSRSIDSILSSYILACLIQNDMFDLQPVYKKGEIRNERKPKDYCKALNQSLFKSIKVNKSQNNLVKEFDKLFTFISDGTSFSSYENNLKNVNNHPSDPSGTAKWHIRSRYNWINFVPIVFGNKKTLEFRQHSITFNFEKIINFLFNCACFVKTAELNKKEILDQTSNFYSDITKSENKNEWMKNRLVKTVLPQLSKINDRNKEYNKIRKSIMTKLSNAGDLLGEKESSYDKLYKSLKSEFWD